MAYKDSKAAGHETTDGFAFVPPNRAMAPVGQSNWSAMGAVQPDYGS
jgi:hypothetical protein